jgi:hypothetical protein
VKSTKRATQSTRIGECIYCGTKGLITDDHVPPRSFYPAVAPKNLITVPSCEHCNAGFAEDDDYVRLVLTSDEKARGNADRDQVLPKVMRFAGRRESKRSLAAFYDSLRMGYHQTPRGVYVWTQHFTVQGERLDRFAQRVVKALFWREKGHRLPDGYAVTAINHARLKDIERQAGAEKDFLPFIIAELNGSEFKQWGEVFGYFWVQSPNHPEQTWWLLEFYGTRYYLCSTYPRTLKESLA